MKKLTLSAGAVGAAVLSTTIGFFVMHPPEPLISKTTTNATPTVASQQTTNIAPIPAAIPLTSTPSPAPVAPTQTQPTITTVLNTSGTGQAVNISFTPSNPNWTMNYTYSGADGNGITFMVKVGMNYIGHHYDTPNGSGSFGGGGLTPSLRIQTADATSWTVTVTE